MEISMKVCRKILRSIQVLSCFENEAFFPTISIAVLLQVFGNFSISILDSTIHSG